MTVAVQRQALPLTTAPAVSTGAQGPPTGAAPTGAKHRPGALVSPHSLRRAFCTAGLISGVPLRDMQYAMRHADSRTPCTTTCSEPTATVTQGTQSRPAWPAGQSANGAGYPALLAVPVSWLALPAARGSVQGLPGRDYDERVERDGVTHERRIAQVCEHANACSKRVKRHLLPVVLLQPRNRARLHIVRRLQLPATARERVAVSRVQGWERR